jgi:hypothetical protein
MLRMIMLRSLPLCCALALLPLAAHAEKRWYKGNTHTHTLWSDGNDFPEMIVDWYQQRGYHFLALSDHNALHTKELWMDVASVEKRRKSLGKTTLQKYEARFGKEWVQLRTEGGVQEVRLRKKEEYAPLFEKPGSFLLMDAEEISASFQDAPLHMNALNLKEELKPIKDEGDRVQTMRANLRAVQAQSERLGVPMMTHINHPNFRWALSPEEMAAVSEEHFFEIYNGHPMINWEGDELRPGHERIWDVANTLRLVQHSVQPLYGLGTDDAHNYHGEISRPGRGWVMVRAEGLDAASLIAAMRAGDFYASSGVTLEEVSFSDGELHLQIKAEPGVTYTTEIRGTLREHDRGTVELPVNDPKDPHATRLRHSADIGKVLATLSGTDIRWKPSGQELYFRAIVTASLPPVDPSYEGQLQKAWTQPMGWLVKK